MKLSHAFFVVLLLHIILIGGIFGFNYMKARQIPPISSSPAHEPTVLSPTTTTAAPRAASSTEAKSAAAVTTPASFLANPQPSSLSPPSTTREEHQQMQSAAYKPLVMAPPIAAPVVSANHAPSVVAANTVAAPAVGTHAVKGPSSQEIRNMKNSVKKEGNARGSSSGGTQQKIYVVVAGDNPYSIARKFKINYVQLLTANHIQDPTKLQIGTQLKIPVKDE